MDLKKQEWDEAYENGGNICFYPHEEIVRFVSKKIKKRIGFNKFEIIRDMKKALDIGCGMGRHVNYLDEMGFEAHGIDLSETAIIYGKEWFKRLGKENLAQNLIIGSITDMPYEDNSFDFGVSHGVFDSMSYEIAADAIKETARVIARYGLIYLDLIMPIEETDKSFEEIVTEDLEHGTIQLYYTLEKAHELLDDYFEIVELKVISWNNENGELLNKRMHIIAERK